MTQYTEFAHVYDMLMYDIPYKAWAKTIKQKLGACKSVVELGCGTGSMTTLLSKEFAEYIAFDISDEMLRVAEEKLRENGGFARLFCGDMATFSLPHKVDAAICVCDGYNYLTELEQVNASFECVSRALVPGGMFVFDISSESKLLAMADKVFFEDNDDVTYFWSNSVENRKITMELTFFVACGEQYRRFDETHVQRAHTTAEIEELLKKNGFSVVAITDGYSEKSADGNSQRITFIAKKTGKQ